jgi:hypothetical protein
MTRVHLNEIGKARFQRARTLVTLSAPLAAKVVAQKQRVLQSDVCELHLRMLKQLRETAVPHVPGSSRRSRRQAIGEAALQVCDEPREVRLIAHRGL